MHRSKMMKYKVIVSFLILIGIMAFSYHYTYKFIKNAKDDDIRSASYIEILPDFRANDLFGNILDTNLFMGKRVYIQFIDLRSNIQINYFNVICSKYRSEELIKIAIIKNQTPTLLEQFLNRVDTNINKGIHIIVDNYKNISDLLGAPRCCESYFLFNEFGHLAIKSYFWNLLDQNTQLQFERVIAGDRSDLFSSLKPGASITNINWLCNLKRYLGKEMSEFYLIAIFRNVCMECLNGEIIKKFKQITSKHDDKISGLIIIPDIYSERDVENMKLALKLDANIIRADKDMSCRRDQLSKLFDEGQISNIVFLMHKSGTIMEVMNPKSYMEFFDDIEITTQKLQDIFSN